MRNREWRRIPSSVGDGLPALDVFWFYRRRPVTDLNLVKAARAAMIWRRFAWPDKLHIISHYSRWLFWFPKKAVLHLRSDGREARRRYGRSFAGQLLDILRIAAVNGTPPSSYYLAALARYGGADTILKFPPFALIRETAKQLSTGGDPAVLGLLNNKSVFESRCRAAGLPVVETIAIARKSTLWTREGAIFDGRLPDCDLILKLENGGQGEGTEAWRSVGAGQFSNADGVVLAAADLCDRAMAIAETRGDAMLMQRRLYNHPDLCPISGAALSTTRVVTMINEAGEPEIVDAFYRTSTRPNVPVDNFHSGGMLFPIDIATGMFLAGMTDGPIDRQATDVHPETGALMAGRMHPRWQETGELALRLHRVYAGCIMPGWDIAVSTDGAVAVEVNFPPGISTNRQATFGGMVGSRMLALLAFHANEWPQHNEPPTSRWRVGITR